MRPRGIGASRRTGWTGAAALLFLLEGALHSEPNETARAAGRQSRDAPCLGASVHQIDTAVWLQRLGRDRRRPLELSEVPGAELDAFADGWSKPCDGWGLGTEAPECLRIALSEPELDAGYPVAPRKCAPPSATYTIISESPTTSAALHR